MFSKDTENRRASFGFKPEEAKLELQQIGKS